jgi:hypothetical protein
MPRRKSGLNTGIRLAPPPVGNDDHPHLNVADLYIGCIVWLPPRDPLQAGIKCDKANCCDNKELEDKGYNHPIIVLSIKQRDGSNVVGDLICCVACVGIFCCLLTSDLILNLGNFIQQYHTFRIFENPT